jgi:hypothetical protein
VAFGGMRMAYRYVTVPYILPKGQELIRVLTYIIGCLGLVASDLRESICNE